MTDELTQLALADFLAKYTNVEEILHSGIGINGVAAIALEYEPFFGFVHEHPNLLLDVFAVQESDQPQALSELFTRLQTSLKEGQQPLEIKELNQFQGYVGEKLNALPLQTKETAQQNLRATEAARSLVERRKQLAERQADYARRVAQEMVREANKRRIQLPTPQELEETIAHELEKSTTTQKLVNAISRGNEDEKNILTQVVRDMPESRAEEIAMKTVLDFSDADAVVVANVMEKGLANPQTDTKALEFEAVVVGRAATVLASPRPQPQGAGTPRFIDIAKKPLQKTLAPIADIVSTVFPGVRETTIQKVFSESWNKITTNAPLLKERFGEIVSDNLRQAIIHGNNVFQDNQKPAASFVGKVSNVVSDMGAAVFRGAPDDTMMAYLTLYRSNVMSGKPPPSLSNFYFISSIMENTAMHWGTTRLARNTAQQIGGKVVVDASKKGLAGLLGRIGLGKIVGLLGAPESLGLSMVLGAIADKAFSFVGGILSGGLRFLSGSWLPALFEGKESPDNKIWAWGIAALIGVAIGIPLLSTLFLTTAVQTSSLATAQGGGRDVGPTYTGPLPAASDITICPTEGSYEITQCSYAESSYTHAQYHEHAYDISTPLGTEVLATHGGNVVNAGPSDGGYGIYVKLVGVNSEGQTYYTIYAHLQSVWVNSGDHVERGQVLGLADNTGNSTGSHLHYEYQNASGRAPDPPVGILPGGCGYSNPDGCTL
jgi:Peptidase family M23